MNLEKVKRPMHILMVEDNPDDVSLMRLALKECRGSHHIDVVKDGVEAMRKYDLENSTAPAEPFRIYRRVAKQ